MKNLLIALSFIFATQAFAQENINPKDACKYVNKTVTITGMVKDYKKWERFNVIFTLAINKAFPHQELSVRVSGEDFLYDVRKLKEIGEVKFTGNIVLDSNKCVMIIDSQKQIILSPKQMHMVTSKPKKHDQKETQELVDKLNKLSDKIKQ